MAGVLDILASSMIDEYNCIGDNDATGKTIVNALKM